MRNFPPFIMTFIQNEFKYNIRCGKQVKYALALLPPWVHTYNLLHFKLEL